MKPFHSLLFALLAVSSVNALVAPDNEIDLYKRKGGGGGGGKGGSSSGGSRGGSSSSSGSRGGSSSSSGSSNRGSSGGSSGSSGSSSSSGGKSGGGSSSSGRGSSSSTAGGRTTTGSGPAPQYGGKYYGGGATVPYKAGLTTPLGIAAGFAIGASLAFWGSAWLYGAYMYHYNHLYHYYNQSGIPPQNVTTNVTCLCDPYAVCGCEDNGDDAWLQDVIGNGSYGALNRTLVTIAEVNGTTQIFVNGTLPNGTTATGGDESPNSAMVMRGMSSIIGFWPVVATVAAIAFF